MNPIVIHSRSGADSKLHLEIPVDRPDTEFEVEMVVRRTMTNSSAEYVEFLRRTAGAWQGDFERPESGPPEERESLE